MLSASIRLGKSNVPEVGISLKEGTNHGKGRESVNAISPRLGGAVHVVASADSGNVQDRYPHLPYLHTLATKDHQAGLFPCG